MVCRSLGRWSRAQQEDLMDLVKWAVERRASERDNSACKENNAQRLWWTRDTDTKRTSGVIKISNLSARSTGKDFTFTGTTQGSFIALKKSQPN